MTEEQHSELKASLLLELNEKAEKLRSVRAKLKGYGASLFGLGSRLQTGLALKKEDRAVLQEFAQIAELLAEEEALAGRVDELRKLFPFI